MRILVQIILTRWNQFSGKECLADSIPNSSHVGKELIVCWHFSSMRTWVFSPIFSDIDDWLLKKIILNWHQIDHEMCMPLKNIFDIKKKCSPPPNLKLHAKYSDIWSFCHILARKPESYKWNLIVQTVGLKYLPEQKQLNGLVFKLKIFLLKD